MRLTYSEKAREKANKDCPVCKGTGMEKFEGVLIFCSCIPNGGELWGRMLESARRMGGGLW